MPINARLVPHRMDLIISRLDFSLRAMLAKPLKLVDQSSRRRVFRLLLATMAVGVLDAAALGLFYPVIQSLTEPQNSGYSMVDRLLKSHSAWNGSPNIKVIALLIVLLLVYLFKNIFAAIVKKYQSSISTEIETRAINKLFVASINHPLGFHLSNPPSLLYQRIRDTHLLIDNWLNPLMIVSSELLVVLGVLILLILIDPLISIAMLTIIGLMSVLISAATRRQLNRLGRQRELLEQQRSIWTIDVLQGAREIQALRRQEFFINEFNRISDRRVRADHRFGFFQSLPLLILEFGVIASVLGLVFSLNLVGRALIDSLPILGMFCAAAFRIVPTANRTLGSINALRFGVPSIDAIAELLANPPSSHLLITRNNVNRVSRIGIRGQNLSFSWESDRKVSVLTESNFFFPPGSLITISGQSGAGKSTLVQLLLGQVVPDSGLISFVDQIGNEITREQIGIGYVAQDPFILAGSIIENLYFGPTPAVADYAKIARHLKQVGLSEFIDYSASNSTDFWQFDAKNISGGQRQRLAIARALFNDVSVMILDEPTSALDQESRQRIIDLLIFERTNRTIVVVTHDEDLLQISDIHFELRNNILQVTE